MDQARGLFGALLILEIVLNTKKCDITSKDVV